MSKRTETRKFSYRPRKRGLSNEELAKAASSNVQLRLDAAKTRLDLEKQKRAAKDDEGLKVAKR